MRILHCLSQRPEATGSGITIRNMLREGVQAGHTVALLSGIPFDTNPDIREIPPELQYFVTFGTGGDLPFPVVGMSDVMPYESTRWGDMSEQQLNTYETVWRQKIRHLVETFKPDVVHSNHLWIMTSLIKQEFPDLPLVVTCHGSDLRQFSNHPHLRDRVKRGVSQVDRILALSQIQKEDIVRLHGIDPSRVNIVGAGFDPERFRHEGQTAGDIPELVYVGKLSRAKGVPELLTALQQLDHHDFHFHLIGGGTGSDHALCLDVAGQLGDKITVHGRLDDESLVQVLQRAHIKVLPSYFEGLPLVTLEALACRCRLVVSALPGMQEILGPIESNSISLVPLPRLIGADTPHPEDIDSYTQNLAQALHDQITRHLASEPFDSPTLDPLLMQYTWKAVFERIQSVLHALRSG